MFRRIPSVPNRQISLQRNPNFLSKEILIFPQSDPNCRNFQQRLPICSRQQPSLHVRRKLQEMSDGTNGTELGNVVGSYYCLSKESNIPLHNVNREALSKNTFLGKSLYFAQHIGGVGSTYYIYRKLLSGFERLCFIHDIPRRIQFFIPHSLLLSFDLITFSKVINSKQFKISCLRP